jgi:hypothetical protein
VVPVTLHFRSYNWRNQMKPLTALALLAMLGPALADSGTSLRVAELVHNGSLMTQIFDPASGHLLIQYKDPRPDLEAVGVIPGTVLFDGQLDGLKITGTAFMFSDICPPTPYRMNGGLKLNGGLLLTGRAPVVDPSNCNVIALVARNGPSNLDFNPYVKYR